MYCNICVSLEMKLISICVHNVLYIYNVHVLSHVHVQYIHVHVHVAQLTLQCTVYVGVKCLLKCK